MYSNTNKDLEKINKWEHLKNVQEEGVEGWEVGRQQKNPKFNKWGGDTKVVPNTISTKPSDQGRIIES